MSQVRLDFMGPVSSTGGKVGICSDYLRNVGKGMKSSFQNSDKEFQSSSNSCPPFSLSKVSSMRADNHFQVHPFTLKVHLTPEFFFGRDEIVQRSHKEFDNFISIWYF